jgi:hypothetical protein
LLSRELLSQPTVPLIFYGGSIMGKGYEGADKSKRTRARRKRIRVSTSGLGTDESYKEEDMEGVKALLIVVGMVAFGLALWYVTSKLSRIFTYLDHRFPDRVTLGIYVSLATLIAGALLFALREIKRRLYACIELMFALVTAGVAIGKLKTQGELAVWLALAASAYLVVRGLENLQRSGANVPTLWTEFLNSRLIKKRSAGEIVTGSDESRS